MSSLFLFQNIENDSGMAWDILPVLNTSPESDNDDDDPDFNSEDYHEEWYSNSSESCRTSDEEIEIPQKRLKSENKRAVTNELKRNLKVIFSTTYISNLISIPTNFKRNVSPMFFNNNFRSADFSGVSGRPLSTVALLSLYFNFPRGWLRS